MFSASVYGRLYRIIKLNWFKVLMWEALIWNLVEALTTWLARDFWTWLTVVGCCIVVSSRDCLHITPTVYVCRSAAIQTLTLVPLQLLFKSSSNVNPCFSSIATQIYTRVGRRKRFQSVLSGNELFYMSEYHPIQLLLYVVGFYQGESSTKWVDKE